MTREVESGWGGVASKHSNHQKVIAEKQKKRAELKETEAATKADATTDVVAEESIEEE